MPPFLALVLWFVLLVALFWWDPAKDSRVSLALWVPCHLDVHPRIAATFAMARRRWGAQAQAFEEGNPLDRTIFFILILLAIGILMSRSFKWGDFFAHNFAIVAFVSFALMSVFWSDFPLATFKKWFRDLGNYFVILVVLSDPCPLEAVRTVLRRLSYLLIPLCILLDKYYPNLSRHIRSLVRRRNVRGSHDKQEYAWRHCLAQRTLFFLGYDHAMVRSKRPSDEADYSGERGILCDVPLGVEYRQQRDLPRMHTTRLSGDCGGSQQIISAPSRLLKALIPSSFCVYLILAYGLA